MSKRPGMNKYQKAAHRPGEPRVSRAEVAELLEMACSLDPEDRLVAAKYLCPCHIKGRIPAVWDALYRMMEDADRRVRFAAWHTLEDGGLPGDPETFARLEQLYQQETDPKVRKFAWQLIGQEVAARQQQEMMRGQLAAKPAARWRAKCDFCGESNVLVTHDLETVIPTHALPRPALICDRCAQTA